MNYLIIILITFISGVVGTGLGGVVGAVMKRDSNKIVSLLLSFAAGIMLAVVCFDLMSEPLHMMEEGTLPSLTPLIIVASVTAGYGIVYLLNFLIDKRTNREVKHIDENIREPITLDSLAENFNFSKSYISNEFRKAMKIPIMQYVRAKKIIAAHRLILNGEKKRVVAEMFSFDDYSTFYRSYVKVMGFSPTDIKKQSIKLS